METALTSLRLRPLLRSARAAKLIDGCRAAATALYFHSVPHPLSEVLYWNAMYLRARWTRW